MYTYISNSNPNPSPSPNPSPNPNPNPHAQDGLPGLEVTSGAEAEHGHVAIGSGHLVVPGKQQVE